MVIKQHDILQIFPIPAPKTRLGTRTNFGSWVIMREVWASLAPYLFHCLLNVSNQDSIRDKERLQSN